VADVSDCWASVIADNKRTTEHKATDLFIVLSLLDLWSGSRGPSSKAWGVFSSHCGLRDSGHLGGKFAS
jgi:hypothetical protein